MKDLTVFIRPSFAKVAGDPCKAALFDHILYQIAKKAKGQSREAIQEGKITYYKTNEELTELMLNTWGLCKVRHAVNDLMDLGLLGKSKSPWGADRTKHFHFGQVQCRKLLELCQKHGICLHNIGLDPQVIQLMILSNGNDNFIKCSCDQLIKLSNGNDESIEAITKRTTKRTENKENNERKNGASQQNSHVSAQNDVSHSFAHSSLNFSSSLSSTQETKQTKPEEKPEVSFSAEEQRIHDYWKELGFEADITAKLKEHWEKLVGCIESIEQFKSLYEYTKQQIENNPGITNKRVNPGNLTNTNNLNGWKQAQEKKNKVTAENKHLQPVNKNVRTGHAEMIINYNKKAIARGWLIAKDEGFLGDTATDSDIANVINKWSRLYKDAEHAEEHLKSAKKIQYHCAFDNNSFFAMLHDVKDDTDNSGDRSMSMFLAILAKKLGCNQTLSTSNQKPAEKDAMPQKRPTRPNNRVPLSDDALRNRIGRLCKAWQDDNLEMHFQEAKRLQQEFGLDNDELSNSISKVVPETTRYSNPTMQDLFKNLRSALSKVSLAS